MRFAALLVTALFSTQAWGAQCVQVVLKDVNGLQVTTETPLVGFVMGDGAPMVDFMIPPGARAEGGVSVPCPAALVAAMDKVFKDNCLTEEKRAAVVKANATTADAVNARCKDIYAALNTK